MPDEHMHRVQSENPPCDITPPNALSEIVFFFLPLILSNLKMQILRRSGSSLYKKCMPFKVSGQNSSPWGAHDYRPRREEKGASERLRLHFYHPSKLSAEHLQQPADESRFGVHNR